MILVNQNEFDSHRFYMLTHKIKNTKAQYAAFLDAGEAIQGSRYNDDERIARMILGYIYGEAKMDLELAKKNFLALSSTEIEPYIKKAVIESAEADYYYTYEKRWD